MPWTKKGSSWRAPNELVAPAAARRREVLEGIGDVRARLRVDGAGQVVGRYVGGARGEAPDGRGAYTAETSGAPGASVSGQFSGEVLAGPAAIWLTDGRWYRGAIEPGTSLDAARAMSPALLRAGVGRLGRGLADAGVVEGAIVGPPSVKADALSWELLDHEGEVMQAPQLASDGLSYAKVDSDRAVEIHTRDLRAWHESREEGRPPDGLFRNERNQVVKEVLGPNAALEDFVLSIPRWPLEMPEGPPSLELPAALTDPVWGVPMLEPEHPTRGAQQIAGPVRDRVFRMLERGMFGAPPDGAQPDERLETLALDFIGLHALERAESDTPEKLIESLTTRARARWAFVDVSQSNLPWSAVLSTAATREPSLQAVVGSRFFFRGDLRSHGALTFTPPSAVGTVERRSFAGEFSRGRPQGRGRMAIERRDRTGDPWAAAFEAVGVIAATGPSSDALDLEGPSLLRWAGGVELLGDFSRGQLAANHVRIDWPDGGWYEGPVDRAWARSVRVTFGAEPSIPGAPVATSELYARGRGLFRDVSSGVELELSAPGMVGHKTWSQPFISEKAHEEKLVYQGTLSLAGAPEGEGRLEAYDASGKRRHWSYRGGFADGLPSQPDGQAELTFHLRWRPATYRGTLQVRSQFAARVLAPVWVFAGGEGRLEVKGRSSSGRLLGGALFTRPPTLQAGPAPAPLAPPPVPSPPVPSSPAEAPAGMSSSSDAVLASEPPALRAPRAPRAPQPESFVSTPGPRWRKAEELKAVLQSRAFRGPPLGAREWLHGVSELSVVIVEAHALALLGGIYSHDVEARRDGVYGVLHLLRVLSEKSPQLYSAAVALETHPDARALFAIMEKLATPADHAAPAREAAFTQLINLQRDVARGLVVDETGTVGKRGLAVIRAEALQLLTSAMHAPELEPEFEAARLRIEDARPALRSARSLVERARALATDPPASPEDAVASFVSDVLELEAQLPGADGWEHPRLEGKLDEVREALGDHSRSRAPAASVALLRAIEDRLRAAHRSPLHLTKKQVRQGKGINEGFWYESVHIEALLRDVARDAGAHQNLVSAGSPEQLIGLLSDLAAPGGPSGPRSARELWIAPYNPTLDHWTAVLLEVQARGGAWSVTRGVLIDPKSAANAPFPQALAAGIEAALPGGRPKWLPGYAARQGDDVSCGPLVVESVRHILESSKRGALQVPKKVEPVDIRALRARHAEALARSGHSDFEIAQRYDVAAASFGS